MRIKYFLLIVILSVLLLSITGQLSALTVLEWSGQEWSILSQDQKIHVVFGFLLAAQTMRETYGELEGIRYFTHDGETVKDIVQSVDIYYMRNNNKDVPLFKVIVRIAKII